MALAVESENSQLTVIGTEHQLLAPTTSNARVLRVDLGPMVAVDTVELRVKTKVRSTGTIREQYVMTYLGTPGWPIIETPPIAADLGATFTLKQTLGSPRTFDWKIVTFLVPAVESENTTTPAGVGTPVTFASPSTNKTRVLRLDLSNLTATDQIALQIQTKVRSTGTLRNQFYHTFGGVINTPIVESVPISSDLGASFILTQIAGTTMRAIDWKVLTLD